MVMCGSRARLVLVVAAALSTLCAGCGGGGGQAGTGGTSAQGGHGGTSGLGGASGLGGHAGASGLGGAAGGAAVCPDGGVLADGGAVDGGDAGARCVPPPDPFASATPLVVGAAPTNGTLADPATSKAYYSFSGSKGEVIEIDAAIFSSVAFSPDLPDLVATLYDATETQIARNDDPWPRTSNVPALYTVLPATGTYYLVVGDCNAVFGAAGNCASASAIAFPQYTIAVHDLDLSAPDISKEGAEPGNDSASGAATIAYSKAGGTSYVPSLLVGTFQSGTDTDTYTFTVPTDAPVASGGRARADFWILPGGKNGDGSTATVGKAFIVDASDTSGAVLDQIDGTQYGSGRPGTPTGPAKLSAPVTLGHAYNLVIQHSAQAAGSNDFYFIWHAGGTDVDSGSLEFDLNGSNDTINTGSSLDGTFNDNGTYTYILDADISPPITDVDFTVLNINQPTVLSGSCKAKREGSGILGLSYQLLDKTSAAVIASQTESATSDLGLSASVPSGDTVVLKVSATGQSATVTDTSYVCRFDTAP